MLLDNLSEAEEEVRKYFQSLDQDILTEETLTEEQIINMVLIDEKEKMIVRKKKYLLY